MKKTLIAILAIIMTGCASSDRLSKQEIALIEGQGEVMKIYQIDSREDSLLLRQPSCDFTIRDLNGEAYKELARKMVETLKSTGSGVGIAGPQVGLNRRVVVVKRYDKEGYPFEVYPNISIEPATDEKALGPEGCLSVPDHRGQVLRYTKVNITYTDLETMEPKTETVEGFSAVIFQHECDHLEGVLYIDKCELL